MSEKKLLSCPFCGGEAIYEIDTKDEIVDKIPSLFCNWCKFTFTVENDSPYMEDEKTHEYLKEKTIKAWNTRVPMQKIVERLEEEVNSWGKVYNVIKNRGYIDDYTVGAYDGYRNSVTIVKEEGGLDV
jgi:transposase-like protein